MSRLNGLTFTNGKTEGVSKEKTSTDPEITMIYMRRSLIRSLILVTNQSPNIL